MTPSSPLHLFILLWIFKSIDAESQIFQPSIISQRASRQQQDYFTETRNGYIDRIVKSLMTPYLREVIIDAINSVDEYKQLQAAEFMADTLEGASIRIKAKKAKEAPKKAPPAPPKPPAAPAKPPAPPGQGSGPPQAKPQPPKAAPPPAFPPKHHQPPPPPPPRTTTEEDENITDEEGDEYE